MQSIAELLKNKSIKPDTRNKYEFQAYGNRLAEELGDQQHRTLYIKLAKSTDRNLLDAAREFVMRSEHADTRGKLFMWKLSELKKIVAEKKAKKDETQTGQKEQSESQTPLKPTNK